MDELFVSAPAIWLGILTSISAACDEWRGLPVFAFAVLPAPGAQWPGKALQRVARLEKWARRITAVIFIIAGIRFCRNHIFEVQI